MTLYNQYEWIEGKHRFQLERPFDYESDKRMFINYRARGFHSCPFDIGNILHLGSDCFKIVDIAQGAKSIRDESTRYLVQVEKLENRKEYINNVNKLERSLTL